MYQPPLSDSARERLSILRETSDGFVIAERDLQLRGPGEVFGTRQTGAIQFKVADLNKHADLIEQIADIAHTIHSQNPEAVPAIIDRWLAKTTDYAEV
jgi:ATP-dependent DNA helicase RecG